MCYIVFFLASTALHSLEHGFRTAVIESASRGVDIDEIDKMKKKLKLGGAVICDASEVCTCHAHMLF